MAHASYYSTYSWNCATKGVTLGTNPNDFKSKDW
jgi:hypothetical protein